MLAYTPKYSVLVNKINNWDTGNSVLNSSRFVQAINGPAQPIYKTLTQLEAEGIWFIYKIDSTVPYQWTNIFIDNEISVLISTESNLKYTIQKLGGNIPVVDSIITMESLTPIPEIFINLTADISTTQLTEMKRVLPVINTSLSNLDVFQEYVLSGHGVKYKKYADDLILFYETLAINPLANTALDDFIISPSSLVDMNVEMVVSASSILPQKFASAQNLVFLYRIDLGDVSIAEVADETFTDLLLQSLYEGTSTTYETSTFESIYNVQPKQYQEYIKILPATTTEMNTLSVDR